MTLEWPLALALAGQIVVVAGSYFSLKTEVKHLRQAIEKYNGHRERITKLEARADNHDGWLKGIESEMKHARRGNTQ